MERYEYQRLVNKLLDIVDKHVDRARDEFGEYLAVELYGAEAVTEAYNDGSLAAMIDEAIDHWNEDEEVGEYQWYTSLDRQAQDQIDKLDAVGEVLGELQRDVAVAVLDARRASHERITKEGNA